MALPPNADGCSIYPGKQHRARGHNESSQLVLATEAVVSRPIPAVWMAQPVWSREATDGSMVHVRGEQNLESSVPFDLGHMGARCEYKTGPAPITVQEHRGPSRLNRSEHHFSFLKVVVLILMLPLNTTFKSGVTIKHHFKSGVTIEHHF